MAVVDTSNIINLDDTSNLFTQDGSSRVLNTTTNTSGAVSNTPVSRTISFTLTSTPSGASILLNGVNTNFITPYVMKFEETELLTPKVISVVNGTNNSLETYVISTEVVTKTTGTSNGDDSKGDGSQFGPTSTGGGGSGPTLPTDTQEDTKGQTGQFNPSLAPGPRPGRGGMQ